jgi:hypothetical protein
MGMSGSNVPPELKINIGNIVSTVVNHYDGKGGGSLDYGQGFISKSDIRESDIFNDIKQAFPKK